MLMVYVRIESFVKSVETFGISWYRRLDISATSVLTTNLVIENRHPRRIKERRNLLK